MPGIEPHASVRMDLKISGNADRVNIHPSGELVTETCGELRRSLQEVLAREPTAVVVDLSAVPFIDTSGVGVLVGLRKQFKSRSIAFSVSDPLPAVGDVLRRMKLDEILGMT